MAIFDNGNFEVSKTEGVATVNYNNEKAFKEGTDIPFAEMKRTFDYANEYITEATKVAAEQATKVMEEDKDIEKVIVEYPYGVSKRGKIITTAKREQTFRSPVDGKEIVKSTISTMVKDPLTKVSKSKVAELSSAMTKALLS